MATETWRRLAMHAADTARDAVEAAEAAWPWWDLGQSPLYSCFRIWRSSLPVMARLSRKWFSGACRAGMAMAGGEGGAE